MNATIRRPHHASTLACNGGLSRPAHEEKRDQGNLLRQPRQKRLPHSALRLLLFLLRLRCRIRLSHLKPAAVLSSTNYFLARGAFLPRRTAPVSPEFDFIRQQFPRRH